VPDKSLFEAHEGDFYKPSTQKYPQDQVSNNIYNPNDRKYSTSNYYYPKKASAGLPPNGFNSAHEHGNHDQVLVNPPIYDQGRPETGYEQSKPETSGYGQRRPETSYHQNRPETGYGQSRPESGYSQSKPETGYGSGTSSYQQNGSQTPSYGANPQDYGYNSDPPPPSQSNSGYGSRPPVESNSVYGSDPPGYRPEKPGYGSDPSGYRPDPPGYGSDPSKYRPENPGYGSDKAGYESDPAGYGYESSQEPPAELPPPEFDFKQTEGGFTKDHFTTKEDDSNHQQNNGYTTVDTPDFYQYKNGLSNKRHSYGNNKTGYNNNQNSYNNNQIGYDYDNVNKKDGYNSVYSNPNSYKDIGNIDYSHQDNGYRNGYGQRPSNSRYQDRNRYSSRGHNR
jgi:hypothetical protein